MLVWLAVAVALALLVLLVPSGRTEGLTQADCAKRNKDYNGKKCVCKKPKRWNGTKCTAKKPKKKAQSSASSGQQKSGGSGDSGDSGDSSGSSGSGGGRKKTGISFFDDSTFACGKYSGTQDTENIVAVHENDYDGYAGKRLRIYYKGKSVEAIVADKCAANAGSCNANKRNGFLIDLHENVREQLGLSVGTGVDSAEFEVIGGRDEDCVGT